MFWLCYWCWFSIAILDSCDHLQANRLRVAFLPHNHWRVTYWRRHRLDNFPQHLVCASHPPCVTSVENSFTKHDLHFPTSPASHLHQGSPTFIRNPFRWSTFQGTTSVSPLNDWREQRLIHTVCARCAACGHTDTQYVWED